MRLREIWGVVKKAVGDFIEDDVLTHAGALALYIALSLAPMLVLGVWIASLIWGHGAQVQAAQEASRVVGSQGAQIIETVLTNASRPAISSAAGLIGIVFLIFWSSGVFAQLQYSLNRIWEVEARPGSGVWDWLRKRVWTLVMVGLIGLFVFASLIGTAALSVVQSHFQDVLRVAWVWWLLNEMVPLLLFMMFFAAIYKILPDVSISWGDVWFGAIVTTVLFMIGRYFIGLYLGRGTVISVYGAAGSLMALLMWLYYSTLIFFFGAELTQAYAKMRGSRIVPDAHAVRVPRRKEQPI